MPLDFPNSPSTNDTYSAGGRTWYYNGTTWVLSAYVGVVPPGSVDTAQLADNAVTSAKVAANTIVAADIADTTITAAKIADNTITAGKIANATITNSQLASGAAAANLGFTPATTGKAIAMSIVFGG